MSKVKKHRRFLKSIHPKPIIIRSGDNEFIIHGSEGKTAKVVKCGDRFIIVRD